MWGHLKWLWNKSLYLSNDKIYDHWNIKNILIIELIIFIKKTWLIKYWFTFVQAFLFLTKKM